MLKYTQVALDITLAFMFFIIGVIIGMLVMQDMFFERYKNKFNPQKPQKANLNDMTCPNCNKNIFSYMKYCPYCSQEIDWSKDEN